MLPTEKIKLRRDSPEFLWPATYGHHGDKENPRAQTATALLLPHEASDDRWKRSITDQKGTIHSPIMKEMVRSLMYLYPIAI